MDRIQVECNGNDYNFRFQESGRVGATTSYLPGTTKVISTIASWGTIFHDLGVFNSVGVDLPRATETFHGAACVTAFPLACANGVDTVIAARAFIASPDRKKAKELANSTFKTTKNSAESLGALHKAKVINLGAVGVFAAKLIKCVSDLALDLFGLMKGVEKYRRIEAGRATMSPSVADAGARATWWEIAKNVVGLNFHFYVFLVTALSVTMPVVATLSFATAYIGVLSVAFYMNSYYQDELGRGAANYLRSRGINVAGLSLPAVTVNTAAAVRTQVTS